MQDKAHNSLLLFLREPENMRTHLTENEIALDERQRAKLLDTVEKLETDTEYRVGRRFFELFFSRIPCEENGYEKHQVIPECDIPDGVLTEEELNVL